MGEGDYWSPKMYLNNKILFWQKYFFFDIKGYPASFTIKTTYVYYTKCIFKHNIRNLVLKYII